MMNKLTGLGWWDQPICRVQKWYLTKRVINWDNVPLFLFKV